MQRSISAALVAGALALAVPGTITSAHAALHQKKQAADSSVELDVSARRHHRRHAYHRSYVQPAYYARPIYYRPYPYNTPAPFTFGFGFGPFQ